MLEEKIDKLTAAIETLTAAINEMIHGLNEPIRMTVVDPANQVLNAIDSQTPPEAQGEAIAGQPISEPGSETVTIDDLQKICMEIVRKNKSDKTKIKTILNSFGADLLKDLKPADYSKAKAALGAI